jgi:phosphomannomutase
MDYPKRLQGTDGIRRAVNLEMDKDPLETLLKDNYITPSFVETYAYTITEWIRSYTGSNPSIALGFDPRDPKRILINPCIDGIRKAGGHIHDVGIVPTPAIPLYIMDRGLDAGIVITASHNPKDQNGVKLFLKNGLKPFPIDDEAITSLYYELFREQKVNISDKKTIGEYMDCIGQAEELLMKFLLDKDNSWFDDTIDMDSIILVVDCGNGSYSGFAETVLKELGFKSVIDTASVIGNDVNKDSGVVDLEGRPYITNDEADTRFRSNQTIKMMFDLGNKRYSEIKDGKTKLIGLVFDADGDRFYRLDYDPFSKRVIILSGDENAIIQARYLIEKHKNYIEGAKFVTTIESDYNVYLTAKEMGLDAVLTGVGDKWLLKQAMKSYIEASLAKKPGSHEYSEEAENLFESKKVSAIKINQTIDEMERRNDEGFTVDDLRQSVGFAVGSEESGHNVTMGYHKTDRNKAKPVFIGNGLKSALNSIVSTEKLYNGMNAEKYYQEIKEPFVKGFKKTFYAYYTDKSKLSNRVYRSQISNRLIESLNGFTAVQSRLSEEPVALFFTILKDDKEVGTVFIRNSGTEDKTGIYLRCGKELKSEFTSFGKILFEFVFDTMKDESHPYRKAEKAILDYLSLNKSLTYSQVKDIINDDLVNSDRLLAEMENKEKVIYSEEDIYYKS